METVVIPISSLVLVLLLKKIPLIGGNIRAALGVTALLSLIMGGIYNPLQWAAAWISGVDRLAWIMFLTLAGSIYAETQITLGTMDTVFDLLKAKFGKSPRSMSVCIICCCVIAGAILGGGIPSAAIVGVLVVPTLRKLGLDGEHIVATLVMGCAAGSLMPPVSQAIFLSAALLNTDVDIINNLAYFTVSGAVVVACIYVSRCFIDKNAVLVDYDPEGNEIPPEQVGNILSKRWYTLVPFFTLVIVIILRTAKVIDLVPFLLNKITIFGEPMLKQIGKIVFLKGITNATVLILIFATLVGFFFPQVHKDGRRVLTNGIRNVHASIVIQLFSAFMVGAFYTAGQIKIVTEFAKGLDINVLIIGGGVSILLMGMLTGTQSAPQNAIFSFWGPALVNTGLPLSRVGVAGSHLAAAGQGFPPADLTTFAIVGLVGGILNEEINPLKCMFLSAPVWMYVSTAAFAALYI